MSILYGRGAWSQQVYMAWVSHSLHAAEPELERTRVLSWTGSGGGGLPERDEVRRTSVEQGFQEISTSRKLCGSMAWSSPQTIRH